MFLNLKNIKIFIFIDYVNAMKTHIKDILPLLDSKDFSSLMRKAWLNKSHVMLFHRTLKLNGNLRLGIQTPC